MDEMEAIEKHIRGLHTLLNAHERILGQLGCTEGQNDWISEISNLVATSDQPTWIGETAPYSRGAPDQGPASFGGTAPVQGTDPIETSAPVQATLTAGQSAPVQGAPTTRRAVPFLENASTGTPAPVQTAVPATAAARVAAPYCENAPVWITAPPVQGLAPAGRAVPVQGCVQTGRVPSFWETRPMERAGSVQGTASTNRAPPFGRAAPIWRGAPVTRVEPVWETTLAGATALPPIHPSTEPFEQQAMELSNMINQSEPRPRIPRVHRQRSRTTPRPEHLMTWLTNQLKMDNNT